MEPIKGVNNPDTVSPIPVTVVIPVQPEKPATDEKPVEPPVTDPGL